MKRLPTLIRWLSALKLCSLRECRFRVSDAKGSTILAGSMTYATVGGLVILKLPTSPSAYSKHGLGWEASEGPDLGRPARRTRPRVPVATGEGSLTGLAL